MREALLVDARTAVEILSICMTTLRKRTKSKLIPHVRMGRRVFYSLPQLTEMVERQIAEAIIPDFLSKTANRNVIESFAQ